jgi:putative Mg2+ transporter-C (MgtC) family protein
MDWKLELMMAGRVVAATFLGALIGWDRERHGQDAGVRTYAAVALGACVFGLVSSHVQGTYDSTRIAAQVVTGIGFLGAGVILREKGRTYGLTTAATLWSTAAVGLAMAYGMYVLAVLTSVILIALLLAHHLRTPKSPLNQSSAS